MKEEYKKKKQLFLTVVYGNNFIYLLCLIILSINLDFDKDPFISIIIFGIPAVMSVLLSNFFVRKKIDELSLQQFLLKLLITHIPTLLGLVVALLYLFIY